MIYTEEEITNEVKERKKYEADYLKKFIIPTNYQKPNTRALIDIIIKNIFIDTFQSLFSLSLENATGTQLDTIGRRYGVRRTYISGELNDEDFKKLIYFAISFNGITYITLQEIENKYDTIFGDQVIPSIQGDYFVYYIDMNNINEGLLKAVIENNLLIAPQDYRLKFIKQPPQNTKYLKIIESIGEKVNTTIFSSTYGEAEDLIKTVWMEESDIINI